MESITLNGGDTHVTSHPLPAFNQPLFLTTLPPLSAYKCTRTALITMA